MTDLILYTTDDGRSRIRPRAEVKTVWLTQLEMADLFDAMRQHISLLLNSQVADEELGSAATAEESSVVQIEGSREVQRPVTLYNPDAILAAEPLGHACWGNALNAIQIAIGSWCTRGNGGEHHFRGATKMVEGRERIEDSVVKESLTVQVEGRCEMQRRGTLHILPVGGRVCLAGRSIPPLDFDHSQGIPAI